MPVAIVVGGTPKLFTMPPSATGRDDTLDDMIAWPSAMAIMGIQDAFSPACTWLTVVVPVIDILVIDRPEGMQRNGGAHSSLRHRDEQIEAEALRQKLRHQLPLDAVAGFVERRSKGAEAALAGGDRDDAAADAALARQADF